MFRWQREDSGGKGRIQVLGGKDTGKVIRLASVLFSPRECCPDKQIFEDFAPTSHLKKSPGGR